MEIVIAYMLLVALMWGGLAWLSSQFPALRPIYRGYVGLWRWIALQVWRWLWKPDPEKRGGGRISIPRTYYERPGQGREDGDGA